jgi:hypothetical protein
MQSPFRRKRQEETLRFTLSKARQNAKKGAEASRIGERGEGSRKAAKHAKKKESEQAVIPSEARNLSGVAWAEGFLVTAFLGMTTAALLV